MNSFPRKLLRQWRQLELPGSDAPIVVAVSGGADSVALLLALDELSKAGKLEVELIVAHLNHKLRGKSSDADARWVKALAKKLGHSPVILSKDVRKPATGPGDNLEQAARRIRYAFLQKTAESKSAGIVVTGHTLDDQAETILLNLLRGSGAEGLTAMAPVRSISPGSKVVLARPMLGWARHAETEGYCRERNIDFRSDEMNFDESLARVRVRRQLLPMMQSFNPQIVEALARTGSILRHDSEALGSAAARLVELSLEPDPCSTSALRTDLLKVAPPALRRRALRLWLSRVRGNLRRLEHIHILAIENLLISAKSGREIELPNGARVIRKGGRLHYKRIARP